MAQDIVWQLTFWALPVLAAIVFHEVAHGWVANRLGDPTAERMGRLTLNPLAHIDLVGTVLVPAMLIVLGGPVFGWAKPVPVNFDNLRDPRRDMILVSLAGPGTNLLLALLSLIVLKLIVLNGAGAQGSASSYVLLPLRYMMQASVSINIMLAVFNALPIPPLDGSKVLMGFLPEDMAMQFARLEPYGFIIIIVLLTTGVLNVLLVPLIRVVYGILGTIVGFL